MRLFYCSLCGVNVLIKDLTLAARVTSGEEAVVCDRCQNAQARGAAHAMSRTGSNLPRVGGRRSNANLTRVNSSANLSKVRSGINLPRMDAHQEQHPEVSPEIPANGSSGVMPNVPAGFLQDPNAPPQMPVQVTKSGLMPSVGSGIPPRVGSISGMNLPRLGSNPNLPRVGSQTGSNLPRVGSSPRLRTRSSANLMGVSTSNPRNKVSPAVAAEKVENDQIKIGISIFAVMTMLIVGLVIFNSGGSTAPRNTASASDKSPAPARPSSSSIKNFVGTPTQVDNTIPIEREREKGPAPDVAAAPVDETPARASTPQAAPKRPVVAETEVRKLPPLLGEREARAPEKPAKPEKPDEVGGVESPHQPGAPDAEVRKYPPLLSERENATPGKTVITPSAVKTSKATPAVEAPVVHKEPHELEYERIVLESLAFVTQRDYKAALKKLTEGTADPMFAPLKELIAVDTQVLTSLDNVREVALRGAKTLAKKPSFTLGTRTGRDLVIGEGSSNAFHSVEADGINYEQSVGAGKAQLKLRLDALSPETMRSLVEMGLTNARDPLLFACGEAFVFQADDAAEALAEQVELASKEPTLQAAAKRLTTLMDMQRKDSAAQTAYRTIEALIRQKRWDAARTSIFNYKQNFGGTYALARVDKQLEKHRKMVEKELSFSVLEGEAQPPGGPRK